MRGRAEQRKDVNSHTVQECINLEALLQSRPRPGYSIPERAFTIFKQAVPFNPFGAASRCPAESYPAAWMAVPVWRG